MLHNKTKTNLDSAYCKTRKSYQFCGCWGAPRWDELCTWQPCSTQLDWINTLVWTEVDQVAPQSPGALRRSAVDPCMQVENLLDLEVLWSFTVVYGSNILRGVQWYMGLISWESQNKLVVVKTVAYIRTVPVFLRVTSPEPFASLYPSPWACASSSLIHWTCAGHCPSHGAVALPVSVAVWVTGLFLG